MYSRILLLENIPRQKSFGCLSLRIGCLFSGLFIIVYTVLALAQCLATLDVMPSPKDRGEWDTALVYCFEVTVIMSHCITLVLTTIMLVGVLREVAVLMKPFIVWTSCIVLGDLLLIVFCTVLMLVFTRNFSLEPSLVLYYVLGIMVLIARFYVLTLVSSHYMQLVEERLERMRTLLSKETWHSSA